MKKSKLFEMALAACTLLLSILLVACGDKSGGNGGNDGPPQGDGGYYITFDPNGGTLVGATVVKTGADGKIAAENIPTATHTSEDFDGWFTERVGGDRVDHTYVFFAADTVYAHFSPSGGEDDGDGDNGGNDSGDSAFGAVTLSSDGVLRWNKIKGATKYVLFVTFPDSTVAEEFEISRDSVSKDLKSLRDDGFPSGRSIVELKAYHMITVDIGGVSGTQEAPMSGVEDSFRVTKLDGKFSLVRLKYADERLTLNGFYSEKQGNDKDGYYYLYEQILTNNKAMRFKINDRVKPTSGHTVVYYKSKAARAENDATQIWNSNELATGYPQINHGNNMYYARVINSETDDHYDYDLCVRGLYKLTVTRYNRAFTTSGGLRTNTDAPIGSATEYTEGDIIAESALYDGVKTGYIGRDSGYNVIGRGDIVVTVSNNVHPDVNSKVEVNYYFYGEDVVRADCVEYKETAVLFALGESEAGWTLNVGATADVAEVTVPDILIGKKVLSASFFMSSVKKIIIADGTTEFNVEFGYCNDITDIYLPSTIATMPANAFGHGFGTDMPTTATIHCAFSRDYADANFDVKWNYIAGTFKTYNTVYGDSVPVTVNNISYKILNGGLSVVGVGIGFDGVIPDTATVRKREYNVTAIERMDYDGELTVGKNVVSVRNGAFAGAVDKISVTVGNPALVVQSGLLYADGMTRIVVAQKDFGEASVDDRVSAIDENAFKDCRGGSLYFAASDDIFGQWDGSSVNAVFGVERVVTEGAFKALIKTDGSAVLAAYMGEASATSIMLPSSVAGREIVSALGGMLKNCIAPTELVLPFVGASNSGSGTIDIKSLFGGSVPDTLATVKIMGGVIYAEALADCDPVRTVIIGDGITEVEHGAFDGCANLQYNEFGGGYYIGTEDNDYYLFVKAGTSVESLAVNRRTRLFVRGALGGHMTIATLNIPFIGCAAGDENGVFGEIFCADKDHDYGASCNAEVPQSLKTVAFDGDAHSGAFAGCNYVEKIIIGKNVDNIAPDAFGAGDGKMSRLTAFDIDLNQKYTVENGILYCDNGSRILYVPCMLEGEITIGKNIAAIPNGAFADCARITAVVIPDTVTIIGQNVFAGCTGLRSLTLPFIGKTAEASGDEAEFGYVWGSSDTDDRMLTSLTVTGGTKVRGIGEALGEDNYLQTLVLPATLTEIECYTLLYCVNLQRVTVPFVGVTGVVPSDADPKQFGCIFGFRYTGGKNVPVVPSSLKSITVLGGTEIDFSHFKNCGNVTTLVLPDTATSIIYSSELSSLEYRQYDNGLYLDSVTVPFFLLYGLKDGTATSLRVHANTRVIQAVGNSELSSVVFEGENITHIGGFIRTKIVDIVIPDSVVCIGYGAFSDCPNLRSITVGSGVKFIDEAFIEHYNSNMDVTSIIFKNPDGWSANGTPLSRETLADPAAAAEYFMKNWTVKLTRE